MYPFSRQGSSPQMQILFRQTSPPGHYFARASSLHPGLSGARDDYDRYKQMRTSQSVVLSPVTE